MAVLVVSSPQLRVYIQHFPGFIARGAVRNCAKGGEIGQYKLLAGGIGIVGRRNKQSVARKFRRQIEAPSRQLLIDRELEVDVIKHCSATPSPNVTELTWACSHSSFIANLEKVRTATGSLEDG